MTAYKFAIGLYFVGVGGVLVALAFLGSRKSASAAGPNVPGSGLNHVPCVCPARHALGGVCQCEIDGVRNPRGYGTRAVPR